MFLTALLVLMIAVRKLTGLEIDPMIGEMVGLVMSLYVEE